MMRSILLLAAAVLCLSSLLVHAHFDVQPLSKIQLQNIVRHPTAAGTIRIESPLLHGIGETVNVSFAGITHRTPGTQDWIGIWSPPPAHGNYSVTSPSKYYFVAPDAAGSGSVPLWLLNMRDDVVAAYFTGGLDQPTLLAESTPVKFDSYTLPMHLHLALTGDATQMRVDWTSAQDASAAPWLRWGEHPGNLSHSARHVSVTTYTPADMCMAPATTVGYRAVGHLHSALIDGLRPNTAYYYQVGDSVKGSESRVMHFWSAPAPDADDVEFVIFGDLGQIETDGSNEASEMDGSILTTRALTADIAEGVVKLNASAAVLHIGDISYARGYVSLWEQFWYQLSPMSPHIPWMTVDGNHERDSPDSGSLWTGTDSGGECGVALTRRFPMPRPTPESSPDETWYSFDFGPIHFTIISTEHSFNKSSRQGQFIAKDLASVDRKKTPFLLLAGHRPMYIDSTNDDPMGGDLPVGQLLIDEVEPLMHQYKVDAAFFGHHHSYQRTCPLVNFTCVSEAEGTVYILTGAAGAGFSTNIQPVQPKWINYVEVDTHGYVRAHVWNRQTLKLDFISDNTRQIIDSVTIQSKFPQTAQRSRKSRAE